jgi:hypothetical protein
MQLPLSELIEVYSTKATKYSSMKIVILDAIRMWLSIVNQDKTPV